MDENKILVDRWEDLFNESQKQDYFKRTHLLNKSIVAITLNDPEYFKKSMDFISRLSQDNKKF